MPVTSGPTWLLDTGLTNRNSHTRKPLSIASHVLQDVEVVSCDGGEGRGGQDRGEASHRVELQLWIAEKLYSTSSTIFIHTAYLATTRNERSEMRSGNVSQVGSSRQGCLRAARTRGPFRTKERPCRIINCNGQGESFHRASFSRTSVGRRTAVRLE